MKYFQHYSPYYWNQAESSTQNSTSNFRYTYIIYTEDIINRRYRKNLILEKGKLLFILQFLVKDLQLAPSPHNKEVIMNFSLVKI